MAQGFSKQRIQKGNGSWCAMSSFCIGGEYVYTELWGRSYATEPVYACNRDSLYMIKHNGAWVCVRCLGHDFDECALQAIWTCNSDPRRAGKHKLQWMCDGSERNSSERQQILKWMTRPFRMCRENSNRKVDPCLLPKVEKT